MISALRLVLMTSFFIVSACQRDKSPCDDKLVVIEGYGPTQIESQWGACVARNASKIALNDVKDERLSQLAVELCDSFANRYAIALLTENTKLPAKYVNQLVEYKQESLSKIAASELKRARKLRCEAK